VETGARSEQHTLEAIKQRHLELIAPRVREALRSDAVAAAAYATSEETSSLLLACTYPILWFVQAELDPTAAGSPRRLIVAMRKPIRKVPVTEVQRLLSPPTFKVWQRVGGELIRDLLASPAEGRQLIELVGHADVEQFLLAASALGKLGEARHRRRLRELASDYLLYGYALYMINTKGVRDQLGSDGLAQLMVEAAMEISPADFGLPSPTAEH
jgi:hypothetical protein